MKRTMLRWHPGQRTLLADKLMDVANLVVAAIVIARLIGEPRVSDRVFIGGLIVWFGMFAFAVLVSRE